MSDQRPATEQILALLRRMLRRSPTQRILIAAADASEANVYTAHIMAEEAEFELTRMRSVVRRWHTATGGAVQVVEAGQALAGLAAELIIPTPAFTQAMQQAPAVRAWYETTLRTRLRPGGEVVDLFS